MLFTGTYEHAIDSKGRVAVPADIRARLSTDRDGAAFYITLGQGGAIRLYTERTFERLADQVEEGLASEEDVREFQELLFPLSSRIEMDAAGRVRIPEWMIEQSGLGSEVVLLGVRDHLQIRDRARWRAELDDRLARQSEIFDRFARRRSGRGGENSA